MELNYFKSVKEPIVEKNVSVEWWLDEIKSGEQYRQKIELARKHGKGCPEYDEIKISLPAVTWNFKFNGYKKDKNILGSTGFLYYDIDKSGFNTEILDKSKVFSYFSSLSNQGTTIIVQASGITESNFNSSYDEIAQDLGIRAYVDPQAVKKSQFTVLTYDDHVFVNKDSFVYTVSEPIINAKAEKPEKVPLALNLREEKKEGHIEANDTFIKYNNIDLYVKSDEYLADKIGFDIVRLFLPATIKEGKRKHTLLAYCNNLVMLNLDLSWEQVYSHLLERNNKRCSPPLQLAEIAGIVNSIFKYKTNGTLKLIGVKKGKILFGRKSGMDRKDKQSYAATMVAQWKRDNTQKRIYEAIEGNKNKKITAKNVSIESGVSLRTVKRYWHEFKDYVKELNEERKSGI